VSARPTFHLMDVFTRSVFGGCRLAVVIGAEALPSDAMCALAREFSSATTAFVTQPVDPINSAGVRCFSARGDELSLAPHALIGAASLLAKTRAGEILAQRSVVVALEAAGRTYACEVIRNRSGVIFAQFALGLTPRRRAGEIAVAKLAQALCLSAEELCLSSHTPRIYETITPYCFAPVRSREALYRARPAPQAVAPLLDDVCGLYLYAADALDSDAAIHARLICRDGGEAAASAEALAAFAGVAAEFERPTEGEHEFIIEQGHGAGRPARLTLRMEVTRGAVVNLHIGGQMAPFASGALEL
jgi:trans-2,3-dihydro-3-hydroxyanthranilate isomerase